MKATFLKYQLQFKQDSVTSRGVLSYKDTWFLKIQDFNQVGIGDGLEFKAEMKEKFH